MRRFVALGLVAVFGLCASFGLFVLASSWEQRIVRSDFESRARDYLQSVNDDLKQASGLLFTIRAYFDAQDGAVGREAFGRFSMDLHERVTGLRDTGWAPRVTAAERDAFERRVRSEGVADFQILERGPDGRQQRAGDRPVYYPILYLDSGTVRQPVLGFDLASEPVRAEAIAHALETRRPAATPPIRLLTVPRPRGGVMGFVAVDGAVASPVHDRSAARGIVLGAIDIDRMMDPIFARKSGFGGIDVYLYEPSGLPGQRLVYWRSAAGGKAAPPDEDAARAGPHWEGTVSMVDQEWRIVFTPSQPRPRFAWTWHAAMPPLVGLLVTAMIVVYLATALRRTARLERLTADLRETTRELHANAAQIAHMARHDPLTGLPNRVLFGERMAEALGGLARGVPFAVLLLDLDGFKAVNDRFGHAAGDQLLCGVAARLGRQVGAVDTIARLGGDEFGVVVAERPGGDAARRLAIAPIEALAPPFTLEAGEVRVGVSIGIAAAPADGREARSLLARADRALYAAKAAGRGCHRFYDARPDDPPRSPPSPGAEAGAPRSATPKDTSMTS